MIKPWWKLNLKEKAKRSYWFAFACLFIVFIPANWFEPPHMKFIVAVVAVIIMVIRGLYYQKIANQTEGNATKK